MPTPCMDGCVMCGFCCIAYSIDDEKLQKPAFKRCEHLVYRDDNAVCAIHDERQPQICRDYKPEPRFRMMWFDDRLKYYRQRDYCDHLVWLAEKNYLDHLPILTAIKNQDYSRATDVFKYFLRPHLLATPGTRAAEADWLKKWTGLNKYLLEAPRTTIDEWLCREAEIKNLPQPKLRQILEEMQRLELRQ